MSRVHIIALVVSISTILCGCSVITPPPFLLRHELPAASKVGAVQITLVVGIGGGIFVGSGSGVELRVAKQVKDDLAVGIGIGGGWNIEDHTPSPLQQEMKWLFTSRFFGKVNPGGSNWLAVPFGVGGGWGSSGLTWLTVDGGLHVGGTSSGTAMHSGPVVSLSVPMRPGSPLGIEKELPTTTVHWGVLAGVVRPFGENNKWALSPELGLLASYPWNSKEAEALLMFASSGLTAKNMPP